MQWEISVVSRVHGKATNLFVHVPSNFASALAFSAEHHAVKRSLVRVVLAMQILLLSVAIATTIAYQQFHRRQPSETRTLALIALRVKDPLGQEIIFL